MIKFIMLMLLTFNAYAVDIRDYFVDGIVQLNSANGTRQSKYTFLSNNAGLANVYTSFQDLGKAGTPIYWKKDYWVNGAWCTSTYAILFKGTNQSITETGDWLASTPCTPNTVLGYKSGGVPVGLLWSPVGGLTTTPAYAEMNVWRQNTSGAAYTYSGYQAFNKTGLIEILPTYTPPYGRSSGVWAAGNGQTYTDVLHMVMYHGTRAPTPTPVRCLSPLTGQGVYYQSYKDFNSYAIELWMVKGVGIIQERLPFIEDASYWGVSNCNGYLLQSTAWEWYADN